MALKQPVKKKQKKKQTKKQKIACWLGASPPTALQNLSVSRLPYTSLLKRLPIYTFTFFTNDLSLLSMQNPGCVPNTDHGF